MIALKQQRVHYITIGSKRLPLIAKKHPHARRLVVRYDARSECVKITLPRYVSLATALAFAESKSGWIAAQIETHPRRDLTDGVEVPLFGEKIQIVHVGGRGVVQRDHHRLLIPGDIAFIQRRVQDFIRQETRKIIIAKAEFYANQLGTSFRSVALRESSSRWGSCSAKGGLSFCWRLAFAPIEVLDYVVCHEVAHLLQHNHSTAYWRIVAQLCPSYERYERWLKTEGQTVWMYG